MTRRAATSTLHNDGDGAVVRRTTLPNGLRIVTEFIPGVRSAAVGAWIGVGSRDENARQLGAAHFLEHLLFKGTRRRSAWQISAEIEAVGGEMNAFTTKEYTCFYARVLDRDLPMAIDVVGDLVSDGLLAAADIESERGVILEEIAMTEDDPADGVHDLAMATHFGNTPLGRPILGTIASIKKLSPRGIRSFYQDRYTPDNMVISVAGNIDHADVVRQVRKCLSNFADRDEALPIAWPATRARANKLAGSVGILERPIEQANVVLGFTGISRSDDRRYALAVLNAVLGGGMSSRLFQSIREQRGLAYSVYSFSSQFLDTGLVGVYAGCLPSKVHDVVSISRDVLADIASQGVSAAELERGRGQVAGGLILSQEDTGARMSRIGRSELHFGHVPSISQILAHIDAVTFDDISEVAATVLSGRPTLAVIGPMNPAASDSLAAAL
ncbi:MAG: pitrilysin family protein [Candidatus Nanopelagicales bacterium]